MLYAHQNYISKENYIGINSSWLDFPENSSYPLVSMYYGYSIALGTLHTLIVIFVKTSG